jgi:hypothetical protein
MVAEIGGGMIRGFVWTEMEVEVEVVEYVWVVAFTFNA